MILRTCQSTFKIDAYQLTALNFSLYSVKMEAELKSLEQKIHQLVELSQRLRGDNQLLRQQLASTLNENKQLHEKIGNASTRLEHLLSQIPEEEA